LDKSKVRPDHMLFSSAYEEEEEEVYLQISVRQYRLMRTYKYNITQNKT